MNIVFIKSTLKRCIELLNELNEGIYREGVTELIEEMIVPSIETLNKAQNEQENTADGTKDCSCGNNDYLMDRICPECNKPRR